MSDSSGEEMHAVTWARYREGLAAAGPGSSESDAMVAPTAEAAARSSTGISHGRGLGRKNS